MLGEETEFMHDYNWHVAKVHGLENEEIEEILKEVRILMGIGLATPKEHISLINPGIFQVHLILFEFHFFQ